MMSKTFRRALPLAYALCLVAACAAAAHAQVTTGNVRGVVTDPQGAVVPGAKVTITRKSSNESRSVQSSGEGEFQFNNLLVGDDYTVTVEAANFKTLTLSGVRVQLNQVTDLPAQLTLGGVGETVEVAAGGAELVNSTTADLTKSFGARQVDNLALTSASGAGVSGAQSNIGRNTFRLPGINNFDISLFKNIHVGESRYFQLRADFFNAFNHPQYVPGSVNTVDWVDTTGLTTLNQVAPLTPDFLRPDRVLSSHPRVVQLAARFNF
jgi:Carboxypeptidase regulatory-like domain